MEENHKLLFEIAKDKLNQQLAAVDSFTTRAGLILATCGVIFTGFLQLMTSVSWSSATDSRLFFIEVSLVLIAGFCAFLSLAIGGEKGSWDDAPNPEEVYRQMSNNKQYNLLDEATRSMIEARKTNNALFNEKFRLVQISRYTLTASGAVFIIHLILHLF